MELKKFQSEGRSSQEPFRFLEGGGRKNNVKLRVTFRGCQQANLAPYFFSSGFRDIKANAPGFGTLGSARKHLEEFARTGFTDAYPVVDDAYFRASVGR